MQVAHNHCIHQLHSPVVWPVHSLDLLVMILLADTTAAAENRSLVMSSAFSVCYHARRSSQLQ